MNNQDNVESIVYSIIFLLILIALFLFDFVQPKLSKWAKQN